MTLVGIVILGAVSFVVFMIAFRFKILSIPTRKIELAMLLIAVGFGGLIASMGAREEVNSLIFHFISPVIGGYLAYFVTVKFFPEET